ncbi:MAG: DUF5596 domain-containing protein [Victivallales bacterium]|nr:DUF5596 domain-containing protein [Victivallales bacterium]
MDFRMEDIFAYCGGKPSDAGVTEEKWNSVMSSFTADSVAFLADGAWRAAREQTGNPQSLDDALARVAAAVLNDAKLAAMFWFAYSYHVYPKGVIKDRIRGLPIPTPLGDDKGVFYLLVALCFVPHIWENHRAHGIPAEITLNTLKKFNEHPLWYKATYGEDGLTSGHLCWLAHYMHSPLCRLDRLEFWPQPSCLQYNAWRRKSDGTMVVFPNDGLEFTEGGTQFNQFDAQDRPTWKAVYAEDEKTIRGTPFSPAGVAVNRVIELNKSEWENTYRPGDNVAAMHIPFGGGLTPERAFKSFSAVQPFFSKYYPELPFRMIQCVSWIMGKHLEHILPPEANLLNLQHNLYMMPHPSNLYGGLSFLFPKLDEVNPDLDSAPQDNSLRRGIIKFLKNGGRWRIGAMFFDTNDIQDYGKQPYLTRWNDAGF